MEVEMVKINVKREKEVPIKDKGEFIGISSVLMVLVCFGVVGAVYFFTYYNMIGEVIGENVAVGFGFLIILTLIFLYVLIIRLMVLAFEEKKVEVEETIEISKEELKKALK